MLDLNRYWILDSATPFALATADGKAARVMVTGHWGLGVGAGRNGALMWRGGVKFTATKSMFLCQLLKWISKVPRIR